MAPLTFAGKARRGGLHFGLCLGGCVLMGIGFLETGLLFLDYQFVLAGYGCIATVGASWFAGRMLDYACV